MLFVVLKQSNFKQQFTISITHSTIPIFIGFEKQYPSGNTHTLLVNTHTTTTTTNTKQVLTHTLTKRNKHTLSNTNEMKT